LGFINRESVYRFYPKTRMTITQGRATKSSFDVDHMAQLLDGAHGELNARIKALLAGPGFEYANPDDLEAYREKVLYWCQQLANQGLGAMGYPKAYGGGDDMAGYFAVMEALSYHDLSLVIKFGVQFGLFGMSIYFL